MFESDMTDRAIADLARRVGRLEQVELPTPGSGSGIAPSGATYITQTPNSDLSAEQALSVLATGYMKSALTTGVVTTQATPIPTADTAAKVVSVTGAASRVSSTGGGSPVIDIDAAYIGQASITTLGTIAAGVWQGTTIAIANGGTGQTTALAAFNALSPVTTRGDLIARDATNNIRLAIGTVGKYLRSDGTDPSWQAFAYTDLTYSGLTTGQPLRAASATAAAFGALDLAGATIVTGLLPGTFGGTGVNNGVATLAFTGTGGLALSTFTLTVPATGTADLIGTAQTISAAKTFTGGIVANSAISGSGSINLTGTGTHSVAGSFSCITFRAQQAGEATTAQGTCDIRAAASGAPNMLTIAPTDAYNTPPMGRIMGVYKYTSGGTYTSGPFVEFGKENATDGNFAAYLALGTRTNGGSSTIRMIISSLGAVVADAFAAASIGLTLKAAASQSASIQEWQSSAAAVLASVSAAGVGTFTGLVLNDATNLVVGSTTGAKIGTATTQKIGFWNVTPIVQPSGAAQAAVATTASTQTTPWGFSTAAQADAIVTLVNALRLALVNAGLIKGAA